MKITVITPTYNSERYIRKTIDSVLSQSFVDFEYIIVDDCSTDNTVNIINEYVQKDIRINFVKLENNQGAAIARNKGIELASGTYIAFLDSDDFWHPDKLKIQINFMLLNHYEFTYTDYFIINEYGKKYLFSNLKQKVNFKDEVRFNYIACSTVIYDQVSLGKIFMPNIRNRQDWGLWLNILKKTNFAYCINEPLTEYLVRKNSISNNKVSMIKYHWQIYYVHLQKNIVLSSLLLFRNIILHIFIGFTKKNFR